MMRSGVALAACLIAGCASSDPDRRTDVWHPTGANAANIAAMAADPRDLILGRGGRWMDTRQAAAAVERVWQDRTTPLLNAAGAGGASAGAGAPGPGAPN